MDEIWVVYDDEENGEKHTLQLVSKADELAKLKAMSVSVIVLGNPKEINLERFHQYGADKVILYHCRQQDLSVSTDILIDMVKDCSPKLIMFSSSPRGKYMSAMVSAELDCGLTADCINVEVDDKNGFIYSRAAMSDSIVADIKCVHSMTDLCTVKNNVFRAARVSKEKELIIFTYMAHSSKTNKEGCTFRLLSSKIIETHYNTDWQNAKMIFVVGRGACKTKDIEFIKKLANFYGAEIAGTKAAVDEGYIEKHRQIGQSGVNVSANIYVGFGVAGASQHIVGIKNVKLVIAINSDKNAPIFEYADYAIVNSVENIICELNKYAEMNKDFSLVSVYDSGGTCVDACMDEITRLTCYKNQTIKII